VSLHFTASSLLPLNYIVAGSQNDVTTYASSTDAPTPVRLIMDECVKLFNSIFASGTFSAEMVRKICDVLRAGINTLYTSMAPLLPSYMFYLDNLLAHYPEPACALAKAVFLVGLYFKTTI